VTEVHSAAIAGSCVVEFLSEKDSSSAFDAAQKDGCQWTDPQTSLKVKLFFSQEEGAEVRSYGSALHYLYDSVNKHIVPHGPSGTRIQTNRRHGLLQLVVNKRFYPIFQIESTDNGESFHFVEKRGRWNNFRIPDFVSSEMLKLVKDEVSQNELFK
jgi:hypothetical protein